MTDSNKPTLGYWGIRGLGSNLKYQLAYQGVDYNMVKYGGEGAPVWHGDQKPKMKTGGMDFPNLPYFIDGDVQLTETLAIHQYIAAKWMPELLGDSDPVTQSKSTMLNFILYDFKMKCVQPCYASGDFEEVKAAWNQRLPNIMDFMGNRKFLASDETPTYHDFYFFEAYQLLIHLSEGKILEDYPKLKAHHESMKSLPGLKEYLETCDDKDMTFNAGMAKLNGKTGY